MSLTHTNATLSDPIDKSEIETNFSETRAKFGSINNTDISADAGIAVTKLAANNQETLITLALDSSVFSAGWPAATTTPLVWVPFPGDDTDDSLTVVDAVYWCSDPGTSATFAVEWGNYTGGTWTADNTVISTTTILSVGNPALSTTTVAFSATDLRGFGLQSGAADATTLSAANTTFSVSLLCKRVIQG